MATRTEVKKQGVRVKETGTQGGFEESAVNAHTRHRATFYILRNTHD